MEQHFARLDKNGIVIDVIVADQTIIDTLPGLWVMTDYFGASPKNYAGIGFKYDPQRNAFIPPQGFSSWTLDETTCLWAPPIPYPTDGGRYGWDESTLSWVTIII